jgi:hypothetical protein
MFDAPIHNGAGVARSPIRLRALSLGVGVQSTTLALMAAHGEICPMPDRAIFADTGWEPKAVYEHLEWLMSPNVLPFPVHIVSAGNIRDGLMEAADGQRWASIPAFTKIVTPPGAEVSARKERRCRAGLAWPRENVRPRLRRRVVSGDAQPAAGPGPLFNDGLRRSPALYDQPIKGRTTHACRRRLRLR